MMASEASKSGRGQDLRYLAVFTYERVWDGWISARVCGVDWSFS